MAQLAVVDTPVHVDDIGVVHHFMAGEALIRDGKQVGQGREGAGGRAILGNPAIAKGTKAHGLGDGATTVGDNLGEV